MPENWQFWVGLVAGGIISGGGITILFFGALVNRLQGIFQTKEAATREMADTDEHFGQLEQMIRAEGEQIRRDLQTGIGSVGAQIAAQSAAHGREMALMTTVMQEAKGSAAESSRQAKEALHRAELCEKTIEAVREMIQVKITAMEDIWAQRLSHIENLLLLRRDQDRAS